MDGGNAQSGALGKRNEEENGGTDAAATCGIRNRSVRNSLAVIAENDEGGVRPSVLSSPYAPSSPVSNVGDFEAVKASKSNRVQQLSNSTIQQVQYQSLRISENQ